MIVILYFVTRLCKKGTVHIWQWVCFIEHYMRKSTIGIIYMYVNKHLRTIHIICMRLLNLLYPLQQYQMSNWVDLCYYDCDCDITVTKHMSESHMVSFFFVKKIGGNQLCHWYPCFGHLVVPVLGFKVRLYPFAYVLLSPCAITNLDRIRSLVCEWAFTLLLSIQWSVTLLALYAQNTEVNQYIVWIFTH